MGEEMLIVIQLFDGVRRFVKEKPTDPQAFDHVLFLSETESSVNHCTPEIKQPDCQCMAAVAVPRPISNK